MHDPNKRSPEVESLIARRNFIRTAAVGSAIVAFGGGAYVLADDDPRKNLKRPDGRPRLPPGQRILSALKPMGGDPGDANPAAFSLKVHGEVENAQVFTFAQLLALPQVEQTCDVHCVTGWSMLDAKFTGVRVAELAKLAKVKRSARHVIFEAANGYTANVRLKDALGPQVLIAHKHQGSPLERPHGPPARALVPDFYFWKSAKWITGIRFVEKDEPGYWETRGYSNRADPWLEERYS